MKLLFWLPAGLLSAVSFSAWLLCAYQSENHGRYYVDAEFEKLPQAFAIEIDPFVPRANRSWEHLMSEIYSATNDGQKDVEQIEAIRKVVENWFRHGLSQYRPCHNWSLYLLVQLPMIREKYPMGLLDPREIVKSEFALCSQSAVVIQEVTKELGYEFGSVSFSAGGGGHFASAAKVGSQWYFLDANLASLEGSGALPLDTILGRSPSARDAIKNRYARHAGASELIMTSNELGNSRLHYINDYPAKRGLLLQKLTWLFSNFAWLLVLIMTVVYARYRASVPANS